MIAGSNGDRSGDTRPLWITGLSPPDSWRSLRQPGYPQLGRVRHPKHRVWGQPRTGCAYVFPSPTDPRRPLSHNLPLWYSVRKEAGIEDVRLHDLRHTFASHAVLQGIPLPVVSRLLGHKQPSMTLRYAHVGNRETEAAAERIGAAIAQALDGSAADSKG